MGKLMIIGVSAIGLVAVVTAGVLSTAPRDSSVVAAARVLIEAQKKVPSCSGLLAAVLAATAGDVQ